MTSGKETMGEQPIFTCSAHVFHIDPKTKRTWITASTKAVSVSFFYDSSRNLYRIISVEGSKAVINSTITPNMTFTQTSQKFGQWSDVRANTVYGLGFSSEAELAKFIEKFQEVKEATKNALIKNENGNPTLTPVTSANTSPIIARSSFSQNDNEITDDTIDPPNSQMTPNPIQPDSPSHKLCNELTTSTTITSDLTTTGTSIVNKQQQQQHQNNLQGEGLPSVEQQLKYENERLKLALAQSSANAKKWEIELTTLKSNNIRLTSALQESTTNVDEWKRQLHLYKEENQKLKVKLDDLESAKGTTEIVEELRKEIGHLKSRIQLLEKDMQSQEVELNAANQSLRDKVNDQSMKQLCNLNSEFGNLLTKATIIHKDMDKILQTNRTS